jgi:ferredoxin
MYSTAHPRDYPACSGCSLCRLVCPMWRARRDPRYSPEGIAKAPERRAAAELAQSSMPASLCGACDPVCPEDIALGDMILDLAPRTGPRSALPVVAARCRTAPAGTAAAAGRRLARRCGTAGARAGAARAAPSPKTTAPTSRWRWKPAATIDPPAPAALPRHAATAAAGGRRRLAAALVARKLPGARCMGLGEALGNLPALRRRIASADFYVIEARAYHADHARWSPLRRLRKETGCAMNLDLQRIAIPAIPACDAGRTGAGWMLKGRRPARIVVEKPGRSRHPAPRRDVPVLHLAELNQEPAHA